MAGDLNYFLLESQENLQRFTSNLESIISKYDREFSDDEEINISNLEDIKINGVGRLKRQRPRVFGNSRLLTTKRREQSILSECRSDVTVNKTLTSEGYKDNKEKVLDSSDNSNTSDDFIVWRDKSLHKGGDKNNSAWGQTFNLSPKEGLGHVPIPTDKNDEVDGGFMVLKDKPENALSFALSFLESDSEEPSDGETLSSFSSSSCSDREDIETEDGYDLDTDEVYTVLSSCSEEEDDDIQIVNLPQKSQQFSSKNFKENFKEKTRKKHERDDTTKGLHTVQENNELHTYRSSVQANSHHITETTKIIQTNWSGKNFDTYKSPDQVNKRHYTQDVKREETDGNTHEFHNHTAKWNNNHNAEIIKTGESYWKSQSDLADEKFKLNFGNRFKNGIRKRRYRPVLPEISSEQIIAYLNGNDVDISALYSPEILKRHRNKLYKHKETSPWFGYPDSQNKQHSNTTEVDMKFTTSRPAPVTTIPPLSEKIDLSNTDRPFRTSYKMPVDGIHDAKVLQTYNSRNKDNYHQDESIADRILYKKESGKKYTPTNNPRRLFNDNNEQITPLKEKTIHNPFKKSAKDLHDIDELMKSGFNSPDFEKPKIPGYTSKSVPAKCLFSTKTSSKMAKFMKMKESSQCSENKLYKWSTPSTAETPSDRFTLKARRRLSLISSSAVSNNKSKWIQNEENECSGRVKYDSSQDDPYDFSKCGDSPSTHLSKLRLQTPPSKCPESANCDNSNKIMSNLQTQSSSWQKSVGHLKNLEFTHKLQAKSLENLDAASYNMNQALTHRFNTQRQKSVYHGRDETATTKQQNKYFLDRHLDKNKYSASNKSDMRRDMNTKQYISGKASEIKSSQCSRVEQDRRVNQMYATNHGVSHRDTTKSGVTNNKLSNYVCLSSPPARKTFDSIPKYWASATNNSPVSVPNVQQYATNNIPISDSRKLSTSGKFWNSNVGEVNKGLFDSEIKSNGCRDKRLAIIHPQNDVFKKPSSEKSDINEKLKDTKNRSFKNGHYEKKDTTRVDCNSIKSLKYFQSTPLKANKRFDLNDTLSTIYDYSQDSSDSDSLDEIMTISPSDIE